MKVQQEAGKEASVVQGQRAAFKYPSSRVQTLPKPSGFFQDEKKILIAPSFGGEVKPSVPCRRFAACKRYLNGMWKSTFRQNFWPTFPPTVPPSAARISRVVWTCRRLAAEIGTSKPWGGGSGLHNKPIGYGASGVYAPGPVEDQEWEVA